MQPALNSVATLAKLQFPHKKRIFFFFTSGQPRISQRWMYFTISFGIRRMNPFYVYWTVHHLDSWVKRDQLDATCFIITLFSAQHVSDVNTSILTSLRLIRWVTSWVVSGSMCVGVTLQCGYGGVVSVYRLKHWSASLVRYVLVFRCSVAMVVWYPYTG